MIQLKKTTVGYGIYLTKVRSLSQKKDPPYPVLNARDWLVSNLQITAEIFADQSQSICSINTIDTSELETMTYLLDSEDTSCTTPFSMMVLEKDLTSEARKFKKKINFGLIWYLESLGLLSPFHLFGFRQNRSTIDQMVQTENQNVSGFKEGLHTVAIFFDLEKGYDTI